MPGRVVNALDDDGRDKSGGWDPLSAAYLFLEARVAGLRADGKIAASPGRGAVRSDP